MNQINFTFSDTIAGYVTNTTRRLTRLAFGPRMAVSMP